MTMQAATRKLHITDASGSVTVLGSTLAAFLVFGAATVLSMPFVNRDARAVALAHKVEEIADEVQRNRAAVVATLKAEDDGKCAVLAWETMGDRTIRFASQEITRLLDLPPAPFPWSTLESRVKGSSLSGDMQLPGETEQLQRAIRNAGTPATRIVTVDGVKFASIRWCVLPGHAVCVLHLRDSEEFFHHIRPTEDVPAGTAQHPRH